MSEFEILMDCTFSYDIYNKPYLNPDPSKMSDTVYMYTVQEKGQLLGGGLGPYSPRFLFLELCPPPLGGGYIIFAFSAVRCPASNVRRHAWFPLI